MLTRHPLRAILFLIALTGVAQSQTASLSVSGSIRSNPPGIDCGTGGGACSADFPLGTTVDLTFTGAVAPDPGGNQLNEAAFGWDSVDSIGQSTQDPCFGLGSCSVIMDQDKVVSYSVLGLEHQLLGAVTIGGVTPSTATIGQMISVTIVANGLLPQYNDYGRTRLYIGTDLCNGITTGISSLGSDVGPTSGTFIATIPANRLTRAGMVPLTLDLLGASCGSDRDFSQNNLALKVVPPAGDCTSANVETSIVDDQTGMKAIFRPSAGLSLTAAASACNFIRFNWQQHITTLPLPNPFHGNNTPTTTLSAPPEFLDPLSGGYTYKGFVDNSYPFFYDIYRDLPDHEKSFSLDFIDHPTDQCLPSNSLIESLKPSRIVELLTVCGGREVASPGYIAFRTALVGVLSGNQPSLPLYEWKWKTTFNGTSGRVSRLNNNLLVDPGSGSGGITITEINGIPQVPPAVSCTGTPKTLWPPNGQTVQISVLGSVTKGNQQIDSTRYSVADEYGQVQPSGVFSAQADGTFSLSVPLVASRDGNDKDGRVYVVTISAKDKLGNVGSCSVNVIVPRDQRN